MGTDYTQTNRVNSQIGIKFRNTFLFHYDTWQILHYLLFVIYLWHYSWQDDKLQQNTQRDNI